MRKKEIILSILAVLLLVFSFYLGSLMPEKNVDSKTDLVGQPCSMQDQDPPKGYQCYFYTQDDETRKGILLKPDVGAAGAYTNDYNSDFHDDYYIPVVNRFKKVDRTGNPLKLSLSIPEEFQIISQDDSTLMISDNTEIGQLITIEFVPNNGVPMEDNFPDKTDTCARDDYSVLGGKKFIRFDCISKNSIDGIAEQTQFFRQEDGGYYRITANFQQRYLYVINFYIDVILYSLKFK